MQEDVLASAPYIPLDRFFSGWGGAYINRGHMPSCFELAGAYAPDAHLWTPLWNYPQCRLKSDPWQRYNPSPIISF